MLVGAGGCECWWVWVLDWCGYWCGAAAVVEGAGGCGWLWVWILVRVDEVDVGP